MMPRAALAVSMICIAGCAQEPDPGIPPDWPGRWKGPEGTWLEVSAAGAGYQITIRNLDGERSFPATAVAQGLVFERDGMRETLRATDGAGTGMKWLLEKSDCLTVRSGEGFCRD
jgi:hypothetical protein